MVRKRKRARGAGRPPKGDFSNLAANVSFRMPNDMRRQLEDSTAARKQSRGGSWNLSQELLFRIKRSFDRERDERRDPASRTLCYLLAEVISAISANAYEGPQPSGWLSDPFVFRAVKLAFADVLGELEPKGEVRPPIGDALLRGGFSGHPAGAGYLTGWSSPEDLAWLAASTTLTNLRRAQPEPPPTLTLEDGSVVTIPLTSVQQDYEFGMRDASRILGLTKEPKS